MNNFPLKLHQRIGAGALFISSCAGIAAIITLETRHDAMRNANKQIEIQAYQTKDPSLCSTIVGPSYYIARGGEKGDLLEPDARFVCQRNIAENSKPEK